MPDEVKGKEVIKADDGPDQELPIVIAEKKPDALTLYGGASVVPFSDEIAAILAEKFDEEQIEVLPYKDVIYLPGVFYRQRLNKAFGPGGWSMIPRGPRQMRNGHMYREYALYCHGRFVSEAVGEQKFVESNADMTEADAAEGCKTNAIQRCCKDLGIATQLWEPSFAVEWKRKNVVCVWAKTKKSYRRRDRAPLDGETAPVEVKGAPAPVPSPTPAPASHAPPPATISRGSGPVISEAQARRFYAIWKSAGKSPELVQEYLGTFGLKTDREMPRSLYEAACEWAGKPEALAVEGELVEDGNEDYKGI